MHYTYIYYEIRDSFYLLHDSFFINSKGGSILEPPSYGNQINPKHQRLGLRSGLPGRLMSIRSSPPLRPVSSYANYPPGYAKFHLSYDSHPCSTTSFSLIKALLKNFYTEGLKTSISFS